MTDIFVSYAREDLDFAREMATSLEEEGWSVWWDRSIPTGRRYHKVIEEALAAARCVIVIWSKNSVGSDWVLAEAGEGMARNVLAPVAIDPAQPPLVFRQLQTADLSTWSGDNAAKEFRRLVRDIAALASPACGPEADAGPAEPEADQPVAPDEDPAPVTKSAKIEPQGRSRSKSGSDSRYRSTSGGPAPQSADELPEDSANKPTIVRFYAFPSYVQEGRVSTLTWNVKGADRVTIDGHGEQPATGTLEVRPEKDQGYRLVASNAAGERASEVQVRVRRGAG